MHRAILASLILFSVDAAADSAPTSTPPECRIAGMSAPTAGATATWEGGYKDGYADGSGVLRWFLDGKAQDAYEGQLTHGVANGQGYLLSAAGVYCAGNFVDGKLQGPGTRVDKEGKEIVGNFDAGRPVGIVDYRDRAGNHYHGGWDTAQDDFAGPGNMEYALGGSYEGQWRDGKRVGTGTVTYPNGIKRVVTSTPEPEPGRGADGDRSDQKYDIKNRIEDGPSMMRIVARNFNVPPFLSYSELSPEDQAKVRRPYAILQEDDIPPYPVGGPKTMVREFAKIARAMPVHGLLAIEVLVDADGTPSAVAVRQTPGPEVTNYAAAIFIGHKYTPARCGGQPCAMRYPMRIALNPGG